MPNRAILGGSPLGLIGVKSYYDNNGVSTFNAGKTRNIKVEEYNKNSSSAGMIYGNSLFSGYRVFRAWPNIRQTSGKNGEEEMTWDTKGLNDVDYYGDKSDISTRKELHNNSIYDTSILNIIEKLAGTKAQLRPADFAYLKNIGVYPNNRLIIVRRFASPCDDNIMVPIKDTEIPSLATLVSWIPEAQEFLNISFGEEWVDSEADFKTILTSLGEDIGLNNLGGIAGAAGNALPLPGFTEIFQRKFLAQLGIIEDSAKNMIPAGNPNLIKQAKRRKLIPYSEAGSGLKCTVNIKMTCEYELKYISGIDPTLVWMDILGMIARFGTSNSETYGLDKHAAAKMNRWVNNPNLLINDVVSSIQKAIGGITEEIQQLIDKAYNEATESAQNLSTAPKEDQKKEENKGEREAKIDELNAQKKDQESLLNVISKKLSGIAEDTLRGLLQKYRVKIIGVVNALSGLPSTPWHVTIGNPMRPTFCSGDMLVENVSIKLGPILAFNDLPSTITVDFDVVNARSWGLQEIMAKFNSGYLRTVDVQKTFYETAKVLGADNKEYIEPVGILPLNKDVKYGVATASNDGTSGTSGQQSNALSDVGINSGSSGITSNNGNTSGNVNAYNTNKVVNTSTGNNSTSASTDAGTRPKTK